MEWQKFKTAYPIEPTHPDWELNEIFENLFKSCMISGVQRPLSETKYGNQLLEASPEFRKRMIFFAIERREWGRKLREEVWNLISSMSNARNAEENLHFVVVTREFQLGLGIVQELIGTKIEWTEDDFLHIFRYLHQHENGAFLFEGLFKPLTAFAKKTNFSPQLKELILQIKPKYGYGSEKDKYLFAEKMRKLVGETSPIFTADEAWAKAALEDLQQISAEQRQKWQRLLEHCKLADGAEPTEIWRTTAHELSKSIPDFPLMLTRWANHFASPVEAVSELNQTTFKGLLWSAADYPNDDLIRALGRVAESGFKKAQNQRRGVHDRSTRLGNAAIWALGASSETVALTQLLVLRPKIKHGVAQNSIEKALSNASKRLKMTPEDLEEIAVPNFGLENGVIARDFGEVHVEIEVASGKAIWNWTSGGKTLKAAPASVKRDFAAELKELKTSATELEKVFAAQKERLDGLLRGEKSWEFAIWKQRYLEHPLMALLSRRVIWNFELNGEKIAALPTQNGFIDASGASVSLPAESEVKLWHPLFDSTENVLNWRRYFENSSIKQPFKQAHRELYLLTDAERQTRTYSNRFAAHILKQHQFNSLCAARGWKNSLRLMVDDEYPPATKIWPNHALRAEFWIEGIGDDYGTDTNETGTYLRVSTDQVRFYPLDAPGNSAHAGGGGYRVGYRAAPTEALDLESVPPLVFSETMRDCNLFVGVASLGADDAWRDGGPQGHFRDYWRDYSFGELGETAKSRADVLSRLLPRLKIRDVATLDGRFLRVQGRLCAYKIHLGSGNILMEPNDEYLCIVPARDESADVFLPFEGDRTLAVILSKAFLLADDDKIKDAGIVRQIKA